MLLEQCTKFLAKFLKYQYVVGLRTMQDFSIVMISEFVLLVNR